MEFQGNSGSYLELPPNVAMDFGTGSFTIEWWQKETDNHSHPRVFSRGTYPDQTMGVSLEGGTFYFWLPGAIPLGNMPALEGSWRHFAICRKNGTIRAFYDGTQIGSQSPNNVNYSDTVNNLSIGNESYRTEQSSFGGRITNFHVMKGAAKYTSSFTPDTSRPIQMTNKSTLLLSATTSPNLAQDYTNTWGGGYSANISWSSDNPFA
jgi:hypothetical protein